MPIRETYAVSTAAAERYETQKVAAIFRPLAEETLRRLAPAPGQRIIDIACGTGIVARLVAGMIAPAGRVVGVDLNPAMIAVARRQPVTGRVIPEYREADAAALPFDAAAFDLAICQQGLQFFPDRRAALAEMARVLVPRGRLAFSIWSGVPPFFAALGESVGRHLGAEAAARCVAPFARPAPAFLHADLRAVGFAGIAEAEIELIRVMAPAERCVPAELLASPLAETVSSAPPQALAAIVAEMEAAMAPFATAAGLAVPQAALLVTADRQ